MGLLYEVPLSVAFAAEHGIARAYLQLVATNRCATAEFYAQFISDIWTCYGTSMDIRRDFDGLPRVHVKPDGILVLTSCRNSAMESTGNSLVSR